MISFKERDIFDIWFKKKKRKIWKVTGLRKRH